MAYCNGYEAKFADHTSECGFSIYRGQLFLLLFALLVYIANSFSQSHHREVNKMANAFIGEIRMVAFNFAPNGWASCDGQLLPLNQNQALFSLLGTTFGGDGSSTFALPDFRSRGPIHQGQGAGLSLRDIGETGGTEATTLPTAMAEIPQSPDKPTIVAYAPGGRPVDTMEPFLVVCFIIALTGEFPAR